jgi:CheY-like chemotaxis protein
LRDSEARGISFASREYNVPPLLVTCLVLKHFYNFFICHILTAMLAFCVRAQDRNPEDEVVGHCLSKIKMATSRASNLVDQILAFSKKSECEKTLINLSVPVKECIKLLEAGSKKNIEFKFEDDDKTMLWADETHVHQIVMNLCTNACHSMEETGGVLAIKVSSIDFSKESAIPVELEAGTYAVLSVTDTGCGISSENQERIFAPYFTTKKMGDGTGIGLSLVQKLVSEYKGQITVQSAKGKGSSFTVYLPIETTSNTTKTDFKEQTLSYLRGAEHILLVDDEASIIEVLKPSLEELGYTVTAFLTAEAAEGGFKAKPESIDILVTDQILTDSTGSELALNLLEVKPALPVIICSGFSNMINEKTALELGFNAFLKKTFDAFTLAKTIRKAIPFP